MALGTLRPHVLTLVHFRAGPGCTLVLAHLSFRNAHYFHVYDRGRDEWRKGIDNRTYFKDDSLGLVGVLYSEDVVALVDNRDHVPKLCPSSPK